MKSAIFGPTPACARHARNRCFSYFLLVVIGSAAMLALMPQSAFCASATPNDGEVQPTLPVNLTGVVFFDPNHNGQLNNMEWAISGVTIELYKNGDFTTPYKTTTVNSYGQYSFDSITPGNYTLKNTMSGNWLPVPGVIKDISNTYRTSGLGTVNGDKAEIDSVVLTPGDKATNYNFAAQDYPIQLLSKRMLLASSEGELTHAVPEPSTIVMLCVAAFFASVVAIRGRFSK